MSGPDISGQGGSGQGGDWPLPAGQQVHLVAADADFGGVLAGWLKRSGCAVQLHEWPGKDLPAAPDGIDALLLIDTDDAPEAGSGAQTDRPTPESVAELIAGARMPTSVLVRRGEGTVPPTAAVRAGAGDVIFKPASPRQILQSLVRAQARWAAGERGVAAQAADETGGFQPLHKAVSPGIPRSATAGPAIGLTERQSDVLQRVLQGHPSKVIAHQLGISQRTVESHRAAIMRAYGARSLPELVRRALAAEPADSGHGGHGRHGGHGGHARPTTGATG
jgi:FixJ family two-component response regulator